MNNNYFFISKPRCASTHIYEGLTNWDDNKQGWKPHYHITAKQMKEAFPGRYDQAFSFSVARHPYDLVCSWYKEHRKARYETSTQAYYDRPIGEWIKQGCPTHWNNFPFNPLHQYRWLYDDNETQIVSFIMRLEDYNKDMELVYEKIKTYLPESINLETIKQTRKNETEKIIQLSKEEKENIYNLFDRDFKLLGYTK